MRVQKYKTLLKGIEDSRLLSALPMKDYVALEMVQPNCQTFLVFTDRQSGDFVGAFHYHREIKSGFIFLNNEGPDDYDPSQEESPKKLSAFTPATVAADLVFAADQPESAVDFCKVTLDRVQPSSCSSVKNQVAA